MKEIATRPITAQEAEVLELALRRGGLVPVPESVIAQVRCLDVVGVCDCGCRSVYFAREAQKDRRLADTWGRTADGKQIDVMVWGVDEKVTCLDLVDHFLTGELPMPDSIGRQSE
jgi:hypothetical protein